MDMSKAIREGRDRLGMSQEALAERLGVSRQAVSKWEMGTSVPSPENRRALSEILGTDLQVERETAPPVPLRRWKRLTLAAGLLCLALLAALGWILYSAHQDGWPPPEDPQITGVYFYDAAGQEIAKSDFGWYLFPPDSTVNVAVTFQDGREHTVDQVVLFLYPTGTGVAEERQQIGVRRIRDGRTFALFRWQIPASLYSHLEVQLECEKGCYILEPEAEAPLRSLLERRMADAASFGNARGVRNLFEQILVRQAGRLAGQASVNREDLTRITAADVEAVGRANDLEAKER